MIGAPPFMSTSKKNQKAPAAALKVAPVVNQLAMVAPALSLIWMLKALVFQRWTTRRVLDRQNTTMFDPSSPTFSRATKLNFAPFAHSGVSNVK